MTNYSSFIYKSVNGFILIIIDLSKVYKNFFEWFNFFIRAL